MKAAIIPYKGHSYRVPLTEIAPARGSGEDAKGPFYLFSKVAEQYRLMERAALNDGIRFKINTAFRDTVEQGKLYAQYEKDMAKFAIGAGDKPTPVAKPGTSDHERAIAVDIDTQGKGHDSPTYKWLDANAAKYGFVNDVPSEAWHWTHKWAFTDADKTSEGDTLWQGDEPEGAGWGPWLLGGGVITAGALLLRKLRRGR